MEVGGLGDSIGLNSIQLGSLGSIIAAAATIAAADTIAAVVIDNPCHDDVQRGGGQLYI